MLNHRDIIRTIRSFTDDPFTYTQYRELDELIEKEHCNDFYITLPNNGYEYRIISTDVIDEIQLESIVDLIDDCYLPDTPAFTEGWLSNYVSIDYNAICRDTPYGETFSTYDGSEESDSKYYYFRTN